MISKGNNLKIVDYSILNNITQEEIAYNYLGLKKLPVTIKSPFREEKLPSFRIYKYGDQVLFKDFGSGQSGNVFKLLLMLKNIDYYTLINNIIEDYRIPDKRIYLNKIKEVKTDIQVKIRDWNNNDIEYWNKYGIDYDIARKSDIHPLSNIIFNYENGKSIIKADKLSYAFLEHKDNITSFKVYQPYNTKGYKWISKHDKSVISLWNMIPTKGDKVVLCSSVKDALCLYCNTSIPAIALQSEVYDISETAKKQLLSRFKSVYVCYDKDETGLKYSDKMCQKTGFTNIILPDNLKGKDISDIYMNLENKNEFKTIKQLFE